MVKFIKSKQAKALNTARADFRVSKVLRDARQN